MSECVHDRLNEDGICRNCGADMRSGIEAEPAVPPVPEEGTKSWCSQCECDTPNAEEICAECLADKSQPSNPAPAPESAGDEMEQRAEEIARKVLTNCAAWYAFTGILYADAFGGGTQNYIDRPIALATKLISADLAAERERCCKAVCDECRQGIPVADNLVHFLDTTTYVLCRAAAIRALGSHK